MEIMNKYSLDYNLEERLKPLFEAMKEGRRIKSVTYSAGTHKKEDRSNDVTIKNFRAETYWVAALSSPALNEKYDFVCLEGNMGIFGMHWVIDYEL